MKVFEVEDNLGKLQASHSSVKIPIAFIISIVVHEKL